jgi:SAM-dependent methyltransferase
MTTGPLSDIVSHQYERWMYPEPILDISKWLISNWQWFDPSHAHRLFWPDRDYQPDMDILVAGCGTNQAAVLAYTNPQARVTAIDVSQPSLDHHRYLRDRYGMKNLEIHSLPIEEVEGLGRDFDLIVSTGVLHHLADPDRGMASLGRCLRTDGVAAIMLYARYGRLGVEMLQGVFRDLDLRQNDASVLMVREALAQLPQDHPVKSYLGIAPDLRFDAGVVDTFLHGRERSYTVDDCLSLVSGAGLVFQEFFLKAPYYVAPASTGALWHAISRLPREKQWAVMERINFRNGCHFFTACRPERKPESYRVDFGVPEVAAWVPSLRYRCSLYGNRLSRHNWSMTLDPAQLAIVGLIDGHRSLAEISAAARSDVGLGERSETESLADTCSLLGQLWDLDLLAIALA